jgi:hypothetical protein
MENSHREYLEELLSVVCDTLAVKRENVLSECRDRELVDARRLFVYIAFNNGDFLFSSEELAKAINRSRSNVEVLIGGADDLAKHNKGFCRLLQAVKRNMLVLTFNTMPQL